jgi:hypothetical protein
VYNFYDTFSNNGTTVIGINSVDVSYQEEYDYNGSATFPTFSWTDWFIGKNYILNP